MPPRKRRQSAHSEDTPRESVERNQPGSASNTDTAKGRAPQSQKGVEAACTTERKLTARQQSRQDAQLSKQDCQHDQTADDRPQDNPMPSTSAEAGVKQPTRFSTRVVKRPRRDLSPPESPVKKAGKKAVLVTPVTTPETKGKRTWELWSVEDKDSFFEGLCEFGKDFESIHNLIVSKCRKKGSVLPITVKNKEQVRHFYYRTWHKISKLIQPVQDLKKDIQELYGLISYSVLRKKLRGGVNPNDKNWQKLNELVHQGASTIKVKGKRIRLYCRVRPYCFYYRVKTPVCAALKRLNSYEEPRREPGPKLPEKIRLEFRPKTNSAWKQVQDLSQNPRLRISVAPSRTLQYLINFLDKKWTPQRLKAKASLNEGEPSRQEFRVYPHRDTVIQNVNLDAVDDPVVHFCLKDHNKDAVNISPSSSRRRKEKEVCKDKDSCMGNKAAPDVTTADAGSSEADKTVINNCKCCAKTENTDSKLCNGTEVCCKDASAMTVCSQSFCSKCLEVQKSTLCNGRLKQEDEAPGARVSLFTAIQEAEAADTAHPYLATTPVTLGTLDSAISAAVDGENAMFPDKFDGESSEKAGSDMETEIDAAGVKPASLLSEGEAVCSLRDGAGVEQYVRGLMSRGWGPGLGDPGVGGLTVAELYLMLGQDGVVRLEYDWAVVKSEAERLQERLLHNLNNMLRRLSHLATVEFTDFSKTPGSGVACQLCGQVVGAKQKAATKSKDRSPNTKPGRAPKPGKDAATQTLAPLVTKEVPVSVGGAGLVGAGQDGVFRVPVVAPSYNMPGVRGAVPGKAFLQKINPPPNQKPLMRPRRLKPVCRGQARPPNNFAQRTILPKNSQLVTFYPVVAGPQVPGGGVMDKNLVSQTIVGHPINGIQSQAVTMTTDVTTDTVPALSTIGNTGDVLTTSLTHSPSSAGMVEISMSPDDDHTLMRIPASQVGSMSAEMLQAAGLSAVAPSSTSLPSPLSISTSLGVGGASVSPPSSSSLTVTTSTPGSLSPPNLSSLLDMSLGSMGAGGDGSKFMELGDTTFSSLLGEDSNKGLMLEAGLTTPPIRGAVTTRAASPTLHSPTPQQSLFRTSPTPENTWLNGEAPDLSLTSFLESKPTISSYNPSATSVLPLSLFNDCSRDSQSNKIDVDSTLQSMMNENSIDYVKKFADLAEQISAQSDPTTAAGANSRRTGHSSSVT